MCREILSRLNQPLLGQATESPVMMSRSWKKISTIFAETDASVTEQNSRCQKIKYISDLWPKNQISLICGWNLYEEEEPTARERPCPILFPLSVSENYPILTDCIRELDAGILFGLACVLLLCAIFQIRDSFL